MTKPFDEQYVKDRDEAAGARFDSLDNGDGGSSHYGFIAGADWSKQYFDAKVEELQLELEFTKAYLNPADTSFRNMMDTFHELSAEQKDKLIDLSRSLARLAEAK
jgi:hypothetical protein